MARIESIGDRLELSARLVRTGEGQGSGGRYENKNRRPSCINCILYTHRYAYGFIYIKP